MCDDCRHNTEGRHCQNCRKGFFRDPSLPKTSPDSCKRKAPEPAGIVPRQVCLLAKQLTRTVGNWAQASDPRWFQSGPPQEGGGGSVLECDCPCKQWWNFPRTMQTHFSHSCPFFFCRTNILWRRGPDRRSEREEPAAVLWTDVMRVTGRPLSVPLLGTF